MPKANGFSYETKLNVRHKPDHHDLESTAMRPDRSLLGFTSFDPVKLRHWAIPGCCWWLVALAAAQDNFRLAQEAPLLDPAPLTDRPDAADEPAAPPPPVSQLQPVLQQADGTELPGSVLGKRAERKWKVIPFGRLRVIADDNLFISGRNPESDVYFIASPGVALGWGDYQAEVRQLGDLERYFEPLSLEVEDVPQNFFFAKYIASASIFSDHSGEDALDHDGLLAGRWEATKLTLGLRLRYQTLSGADVDVGDRVRRNIFTGAITSTYEISEKTSLELNVYGTSTDYENQVDWSEYTLEDWFNYQIFPKVRIGLGTRFGVTDIKSGSTQTFEQLVGRVTYYASTKLALNLDGGVERRQFGDGGGDDVFTVFNLAATYAPFDGMTISAGAFRRNSASASLISENILATGAAARFRQRFFHRFYFTIDGSYQNSEYGSNSSASSAGRKDDTFLIKPSISFDVTKFLSAETSYQYEKNNSSVRDTTFSENLVSFQINLQF